MLLPKEKNKNNTGAQLPSRFGVVRYPPKEGAFPIIPIFRCMAYFTIHHPKLQVPKSKNRNANTLRFFLILTLIGGAPGVAVGGKGQKDTHQGDHQQRHIAHAKDLHRQRTVHLVKHKGVRHGKLVEQLIQQ